MHQEIDGENTATESSELKAFLDQNLEASQLFNELVTLSSSIDEMESIEPSPAIKTRIMNSIDTKRYQAKEPLSIGTMIDRIRSPRWSWNYALTFAGGAVVGIILLMLLNTIGNKDLRFQNWELYRGTIVPKCLQDPSKVIESIVVKRKLVSGEICLRYMDSHIVINTDLEAVDPIDIIIQLDEDVFTFQGIQLSETVSPPNFIIDSGNYQFKQRGHQSAYLFFSCEESVQTEVRFQLLHEGSVQFKHEMQVSIVPES